MLFDITVLIYVVYMHRTGDSELFPLVVINIMLYIKRIK